MIYCFDKVCYTSVSTPYYLVKRGYKNTSHVAERLLDWEEAGYQLDSEAAVAHSGARRPMGAPNAGTTENRFAASPQFFSKV